MATPAASGPRPGRSEPGRSEVNGAPERRTRPPSRRAAMLRVFLPAAAVVVGFVLYAWLFTDSAISVVNTLHENVVTTFGWYYVLIVAAFVIFIVVVGASRLGDIKLGRDTDDPEFKLQSWLAMLFAAGMGIGLIFWGVAEPISHLVDPRPGTVGAGPAAESGADPWYQPDALQGPAAAAGQESLIQTFLHWGLHPWAVYAIVGLAIAYAVHRRGRPISIRWALEPVLGKYVRGWLGDVIDIVAIVGTLFGVATSLGLGALQIAGGIGVVSDVTPGTLVQVLLIIAITLVAISSVATGLHRGIKWLSQLNVSLMAVLLVFILVTGPTLFLFREFIQSTGLYIQNLFRLSFDVGAEQGEAGETWAAGWTTFYWGWWMSWAPFVGIFIARISRGRTVREFVAGVLLVPTLVSFLWFSVLGGAAIHQEIFDAGGLADSLAEGEEFPLFGLLSGLPAGTLVTVGVLVLIALFFITSSDSGSLVVDMLASGGEPDPPVWSRVFWAALEGAIAIALLVLAAGEEGLEALQIAAIMAALPVSVIMILMCVAIWKQLRAELLARRRADRRRYTEELTEEVSQHLISEGMVDEAPAQRSPNGGTS
ncbi:BCCT family transporter [Natronosporangium hydrolyticum]|uniref:BCCT family transporter n=1 Tax=Natronosporangium hydrolyticum TaxID=2811111 RepID=A0A895Y6R0_9ACTN|nr:BCCT family transporter [Natronosporangium hydrolyticum]QSB13424.1 BCCT family transporter [Natronosporangium hydrolyticum]